MCGILAVLGLQGDARENRLKVLRASRKQRSRGPDATSVYASPSGENFIAFERLNIVDVTEAGRYCSCMLAANCLSLVSNVQY